MNVLILHNTVPRGATPETADVLVQADAVARALCGLGHECRTAACSLDLAALRRKLHRRRPDVVFNLVESLGGFDALAHLAPELLDALRIPYTGCPAAAVRSSGDKVATKQMLRDAGLPTPDWYAPECSTDATDNVLATTQKGRWLIKAVAEHASLGMDDDAVVETADRDELAELVSRRSRRLRRPCFAEQYIDGREFNLSLLAGEGGSSHDPVVLPAAEIDFSRFPAGKPRIVGHRAKWAEDSFEYRHTPRVFDFPDSENDLLDRLTGLARDCWRLFGLRGYARVDFRVDQSGSPWILEINANPCLSPEAGFAAAIDRAGLSFAAAISRILDGACSAFDAYSTTSCR